MEEKKIKGRKRHIVTDTQGHLLHVKVHAANIHDTVSGGDVFQEKPLRNTQHLKVFALMQDTEKLWRNL